MAEDGLKYDVMVERALRGVLRETLDHVAEHGLPGEHHLYITFRTEHPEVEIPAHLHERYPSEMTIVLQHQFWGLEIGEDGFAVTLSFSDVPERLSIPFQAVIAFADPSVRFGLQFDTGTADQETDDAKASAEIATLISPDRDGSKPVAVKPPKQRQKPNPKKPDASKGEGEGGAEKIVTLDTFRKK
jgi:hypothetical protein